MSEYKEKFNSDVEEMLAKQDGYIPNTQLNSLLEIQDKAISELRGKLEKAEKIIGIVKRMQLGQQLDVELSEALKEYRGEETK